MLVLRNFKYTSQNNTFIETDPLINNQKTGLKKVKTYPQVCSFNTVEKVMVKPLIQH